MEGKESHMNISFERAGLRLDARQMIRLRDPEGTRVHVVSGALWITQDTDRQDHWLEADGALTLDRPGLALIHAQAPSEIVLIEPESPRDLRHRIGQAVAAAARATGRWFVRQFGPESLDRPHPRGWHHCL
jgi:hypothetical protein